MGQVLVFILPTVAFLLLAVFLYFALKPTQPFVPDVQSGSTTRGGVTYFAVRIENGVPEIFHGCYGEIVEFARTDGVSEGLLKQGDRLIWGVSEDRFQETVTFTSMSSETLLLAVFDSKDPDHFKVPIGINTHRTLEREGSYIAKVEVAAKGNATPSRFSFSIKKEGETIGIGRITQLEK